MPNRIEGSSPVAAPQEDHVAGEQPTLRSHEENQVSSWSSPVATDAIAEIEESFGSGFSPDLDAINHRFGMLSGKELKAVLASLDDEGKLDNILNEMTPSDRQALIQQAIDKKLVVRDERGKLQLKAPLTESFQNLVADMNALGSKRNPNLETFYNWTSNSEGAAENLARSLHNQIKTLKPGDSVRIEGKVSAWAQGMSVGTEAMNSISRDPDGKFRLSMERTVEAGTHAHLAHGAARAEAGIGGALRVEYTFVTPFEAELASAEFSRDSVAAARQYGKPAAIELDAKAFGEFAALIGPKSLRAIKLNAEGEVQYGARLELDKKHPELVIKAEALAKLDGGLSLASNDLELELHGNSGKHEAKLEMEMKIPIDDPDALLAAPLSYLEEHGSELAEKAELELSASTEQVIGHHGSVTELSLKADGETIGAFVGTLVEKGLSEALMTASESSELELTEKDLQVKHLGVRARLDKDLGFEADFGFERRSFKNEKTVFKGTAFDFVSGRNRR